MFIEIISVVLSFSLLIFVHELGHYLAARKVGVHVIEFSIGFPPKVFSKIIGKTEYLISLIPIGGYVRLKGQGIDDEDPEDPENYAAKSVLQRLFILVSGPLMNLLVALMLMPLVFFVGFDESADLTRSSAIGYVEPGSKAEQLDIKKDDIILSVNQQKVSNWIEVGKQIKSSQEPIITIEIKRGETVGFRSLQSNYLQSNKNFGWYPKITPLIDDVLADLPAEVAGLQKGDLILEIDGVKIDDWSQISKNIQRSKGKQLPIVIERNGQRMEFMISPSWNSNRNYWYIGIAFETVKVSENFSDSVVLGVERVRNLTFETFYFLGRLLSGKEKSDSVGGPIMIAQMIGQAAQSSASKLIYLVAFISLQFFIFNLLPIPALDGGHIFILIFEKISGKTLSKNVRLSIQKIGFSLLMVLIIYISIKDGLRLFG